MILYLLKIFFKFVKNNLLFSLFRQHDYILKLQFHRDFKKIKNPQITDNSLENSVIFLNNKELATEYFSNLDNLYEVISLEDYLCLIVIILIVATIESD